MENSSFSRFIDVLVSPVKTFASIAARPTWLVAFLVVAIVPAISGFLVVPKIDWREVARTRSRTARPPTSSRASRSTSGSR